jgi:hypothetical protein
MASKTYLSQLNIQMVGALDTVPTGFVGLSAKSDGLYLRRSGFSEQRLLTNSDIGVNVAAFNHTHPGNTYTSWYLFDGIDNSAEITSGKFVCIAAGSGLTASMPVLNGNIASTTISHAAYTAINPTLSGAIVPASIVVDALGHTTAITTRTLTLANLGYTGTMNANTWAAFSMLKDGVTQFNVGAGGYVHFVSGAGVSITSVPASCRYDFLLSTATGVLTGYTAGSTGVVAATDTLNVAFSKLQYQSTNNAIQIQVDGANQFTIKPGELINFAKVAGSIPLINITPNVAARRLDFWIDSSAGGVPASPCVGYVAGSTGVVAATDSINTALSKLQYQVSNVSGSLSGGSATKVMIWANATTATYDSYLYYVSGTQTLYSTVGNFSSLVQTARILSTATANTTATCLDLSRVDTSTYNAFLSITGQSSADKLKNISSITTGFTLAGYFKVIVAGAYKWIPYYT